jgi:hypothetical protein
VIRKATQGKDKTIAVNLFSKIASFPGFSINIFNFESYGKTFASLSLLHHACTSMMIV